MSCELRTTFFNDKKIEVVSTPNLVDLVWGAERPLRPQNPVFHLETKYTGEESISKYERVAANLGDADFLLVSALDDIAWLLNLRGCDIEYNPVFFSYLLFSPKTKSVKLYIDDVKVKAVLDYLTKINVTIAPYHQINKDLTAHAAQGVKIALDKNAVNAELYKLVAKQSVNI